ncbi:MAG: hypothetical protein KF718_27185 [Polyangiaceae bacterium]|nr:hypothetical protein [Polyangiaceae bacterium]
MSSARAEPLRVLKLERILASQRAAGRTEDLAVIPALEEALAAIDDVAGADRGR